MVRSESESARSWRWVLFAANAVPLPIGEFRRLATVLTRPSGTPNARLAASLGADEVPSTRSVLGADAPEPEPGELGDPLRELIRVVRAVGVGERVATDALGYPDHRMGEDQAMLG